jgi:DNA replication protein DnaC
MLRGVSGKRRSPANPKISQITSKAALICAERHLLFQVISQRYERGSIVITSNKAFKQWPSIFNGDSTITSAVLDRLLHHAETIIIEGSSYRMKDRIET